MLRMRSVTTITLCLLGAPLLPASAQLALRDVPGTPALSDLRTGTATAIRAERAPVLDGRTTDPIWERARVIDDFLEYEPNEGADSRFRTEVRIAYDDRNLYVLARMFDPAPDSIISLLSRRDVRTQSEQLKLVIDSYHDGRTAYQFITNPAGVKRDFYVYNDAIEDVSWDAVWDVATSIDSLGWVAEFRIPFSQMRFANKREHTFRMLIVRDVARTNARISWPLYRRSQPGYVSQGGDVSGIRDIPTPRRLEVTPYVVTRNVTEPAGRGYEHNQRVTGGADIKYGLSSNLTLDATINPDFGQVEADPAQLNLTAFETFFSERRPFFLEGSGIFTFNTHCGNDDNGCPGLFYSRRIGRGPQLRTQAGYFEASAPTSTTIVGAAKVTGRLGNGLSVGLLDAVTQREAGLADRTIEPGTNYFVATLQQDLRGGQTGVGAMVTSVRRDLDEHTTGLLRESATTAGVNVRHRFFDRRYEVEAYVAGSRVAGSPDAIALTQATGVHNFQRPDDGLGLDPTRTRLGGNAQRIALSKLGGGITRFQTVYQRFSPGFEINDVGFLARADEQVFRNWLGFQFHTPTTLYRRMQLNFNYWSHWTTEGLPTNLGLNFNGHVELPSSWWLHAGMNANNHVRTFDDRAARGGPAVRNSASTNAWAGIETDLRRRVSGSLFGGAYGSDEGASRSVWIEPSAQLRVSSRFSASLGIYVEDETNDNQWFANYGDPASDTTHYTFARLDQTTVSLNTRLNFTASPTLSLQLYAEPYLSAGDYSDWRELAAPRAERYDDRYRPYLSDADDDIATPPTQTDPGEFNYKQLNLNTVLRWEYRPGSTLYAVWAQGRYQDDLDPGTFEPGRDVRNLFGAHPDNTFLIKASYWFSL